MTHPDRRGLQRLKGRRKSATSRCACSNRIPMVRSETRAATAKSATNARYAKSRSVEVAVAGN